jgi:polysaccharide biosynthesis protein PslG
MRRAIATAVVGIGVCLAISVTPAAAAPRELFGITKGGQSLDQRDIRKMRSTGVRTFRFALNWFAVQPNPGAQNFGAVDQLVGDLAARGIRPLPFVYGSPDWVANKPNRPPLANPTQIQAWKKFLALVVKRYGRGGSYWKGPYHQAHPGAKARALTALQIWNEPTLPKYFTRKKVNQKYAKLVKISDRAIKAVDRHEKVVLAGLTGYAKPRAWTFLNKLYHRKGIKSHFDAAALHPYAANIGQFRSELRRIHEVMKKHHDGHTPLWLTEVGWGSEKPSRHWPLNKGRKGQKRVLQKSFKLVVHKRRAWHIKRLFWFDWRDPPSNASVTCSFCDSAGLLKHNHKAKPAYRAFRHFAR